MSNTIERDLKRLERFLDRTNISVRNASEILGVSHSTLNRWLSRESSPYEWSLEAVMSRIDIFDEEDKVTKLYRTLKTMTHKERVEELNQILVDYSENS